MVNESSDNGADAMSRNAERKFHVCLLLRVNMDTFPNFELGDLINFDSVLPDWMDITDDELIAHAETAEKTQEHVENNNKAAKESEKPRFAILTDEDLTTIISSAEAKGTKKNTKWIVNTIEGKYFQIKYAMINIF